MKNKLRIILFALLLAGATGLLSSCATDDPDNFETKPWDHAQPWESPLPSNINNGR
jgi:hypothetical protein